LRLRLGIGEVGLEADELGLLRGDLSLGRGERRLLDLGLRARRVERGLRGDVAGGELGLPVKAAARLGELGADLVLLGHQIAQVRLGAQAGGAAPVDLGPAHRGFGARLLDVGGGGVAARPDLLLVEAGDDLAGFDRRIVVGEDLDDQPRELRADQHGRHRVQGTGGAHARRDRAAIDAAEPIGRIGGVAAGRPPDKEADRAGKRQHRQGEPPGASHVKRPRGGTKPSHGRQFRRF
jgi:hypothetical protein